MIYLNNRKIASLPFPFLFKLASKIRILTRLFRLEPRDIEKLSENRYVICALHKIWLLNIHDGSIKELASNRKGWSDPLNFCTDGVNVYWGDYGNNPKRDDVNIYKIDQNLKITIIYKFDAGFIRHIHNIIWDDTCKCFYLFTGDKELHSGIYMADKDWNYVNPIAVGSQKYRAVVGFPTEGCIIYATDSVESQNNIYMIRNGEVQAISPFPGSCIYGCETKTHFVFSSTVEPSEGRSFWKMFSYKLGAGINDRYSHLITVRKGDLKVDEKLKLKKDPLPMKLFQYGTIMFPKGQNNYEDLLYYSMACEGDGESNMIKL